MQSLPIEETARGIIEKLFFSDKRYDLGDVGRYRINKKLSLNIDLDTRVLTKEDNHLYHQIPDRPYQFKD
jgi:DNA-directed RNA polymerase subunit beta